MFILNGVIQKQLILRKPLHICVVDCSKAFDLVNRNILFYKLMRSGWSGRVIDTLRNLYSKTKFREKCNGMLSPPIRNEIGVNQGGVCSGLLFRNYVSDLEQYSMSEQGICVDENIVGNFLWADDLILFSDYVAWLQKQLNGVMKFRSNNRMIVNESKNGTRIDDVLEYRYLGVIVKSIQQVNQDVFHCSYQYLCDQSRKAIFGTQRTTKCIEPLTPAIYFHMFDSLVRPILTYGGEVWGTSKSGFTGIGPCLLTVYALWIKG